MRVNILTRALFVALDRTPWGGSTWGEGLSPGSTMVPVPRGVASLVAASVLL